MYSLEGSYVWADYGCSDDLGSQWLQDLQQDKV